MLQTILILDVTIIEKCEMGMTGLAVEQTLRTPKYK